MQTDGQNKDGCISYFEPVGARSLTTESEIDESFMKNADVFSFFSYIL